jgi:2,4-diaminopentanoate dehydrogenase
MTKIIRVAQFGVGVIGRAVTKVLVKKKAMKIVAAIDVNNVGCDLGEIAGLGKKLGIVISNDSEETLRKAKPHVVLHTTSSSLKTVYPELEKLINAKVNIVSSCEELSYPFEKEPTIAKKLDNLAKERGVTILATGVNPGFLMDAWPLFMTGVCTEVKEVRVCRIQNASQRRVPFQKKIGAGISRKDFASLVKKGIVRHVGLAESVAMIAAGLGWKLDRIAEVIEPIIYEKEVKSNYITVKPGMVAGVRQVAYGYRTRKKAISLYFEASIGAEESYDSVCITGSPNMEVIVKGGTPGDIATAAMLTNAVMKIHEFSAGLKTMKDMIITTAPNKV